MRSVFRREELVLHGITLHLEYKLVKNLALRVKEDGSVFVTVPVGISKRELQRFLLEKEDWLRDKLQLVAQRTQQGRYVMGELPYDGRHVCLWGKRLQAMFAVDSAKSGSYEGQQDAVCFYYRKQLDEEAQRAFVEFLYKQEVYENGLRLLDSWSKRMGVRYTGLKVHIMKTRWGSCNVCSGSINLNTLLACYPRECLEYIVVHELTHLLETNHTPRFHAIVGSFLPEWRQRKELLEEFQPLC